MYKNKEGKVFASLTEVKNKTGDIFDLVDEFGEVILTSYNKERYKISKIDISSKLDVVESHKKAKASTAKKAETVTKPVKAETVSVAAPQPVKEEQKEEESGSSNRIPDFKLWNRNNDSEKGFISNAKKLIQ